MPMVEAVTCREITTAHPFPRVPSNMCACGHVHVCMCVRLCARICRTRLMDYIFDVHVVMSVHINGSRFFIGICSSTVVARVHCSHCWASNWSVRATSFLFSLSFGHPNCTIECPCDLKKQKKRCTYGALLCCYCLVSWWYLLRLKTVMHRMRLMPTSHMLSSPIRPRGSRSLIRLAFTLSARGLAF